MKRGEVEIRERDLISELCAMSSSARAKTAIPVKAQMKPLMLTLALLIPSCTYYGYPVKEGVDTQTITLERTREAEYRCYHDTGAAVPACARVYKETTAIPCRITIVPKMTDEALGHEVRHCFDGPLGEKPF